MHKAEDTGVRNVVWEDKQCTPYVVVVVVVALVQIDDNNMVILLDGNGRLRKAPQCQPVVGVELCELTCIERRLRYTLFLICFMPFY